jgi:hypothetical protein
MGWASPFEGEDVHVLRGVPTFALEQLVRFFGGTSGAFDVATARQHGLTAIDFRPRLRIGGPTGGAYTALGLEVDAATGQITAHHDSPDPRIDHFFVDIEATIRGRTEPDRLSVLVWLHDAVAEAWMTPSPITLPRAHGTAGSWRTPTILVRFDDGVIGDVTNHPGVVFLAAPPLEVDARGTSITAAEDAPLGATETVNAILPTGLLGLPVVGEAVVGPAWEELPAEQRTVECLPWSATAADADEASANVLVLADGIPDEAEQLGLARSLATAMLRMDPYSWLGDRLIVWGLTTASRERGGTLRWMADSEEGAAFPVMRPEPPPAIGSWTVAHVLHAAGPAVPAPAAGWPALEDQCDNWSVQLPFDAQELTGKVTDATYRLWQKQAGTRVPLNECDTAFGIVQGARTATYAAPGSPRTGGSWRDIGLRPGRMSRTELNRLLGVLVDRTGAPMGDRWTHGEDRRLVVILSGGHAGIGNYLTSSEIVVMGVEARGQTPKLTSRVFRPGIDVIGAAWPVGVGTQASTNALRGRFAHELGHAFGLGDEYGGEHQLPASIGGRVGVWANLQSETGASGLSDGTALSGERLRWNHLRIARAFLLREDQPILELLEDSTDPPHDVDGRVAYRLQAQLSQLEPAITDGFDLADGTHPVLFLRTRRRLTDELDAWELSPPVELIRWDPSFDLVYVREQVAGTFEHFRRIVVQSRTQSQAPILFAPVPKAVEPDGWARLLPKLVRDHVTASGRPLDAPSVADQAAWTCPAQGNDSSWPKMRNRPPLRKGHPFFAARRVPALWTGGMVYDCGLFHPTSHSIMRGSTSRALSDPGPSDVFVPPGDDPLPDTGEPGEFDAVAQYLLIDRLDPAHHHDLERLIALRDPD